MIFTLSDEPLVVTLLLLPEHSLLSLAAALDPMRGANRICGREAYRWRLVSLDGAPVVASCGIAMPVQGRFDAHEHQDLIMIVASFNATAQAGPAFLSDIARASRLSRAIAGIESGSWLLGLAGLLDGRKATTHWEDFEDFAARFPHTHVEPNRWIRDGPVLTTGGAAPTLDMMLSLIRARQGPAIALEVASIYIYDQTRHASDEQPIISMGAIRHREPLVAEAIRIMEAHIDEPVTVGAIACRLQLATRQLERLFQRVLCCSPGAYYTGLRLKAARRLVVDHDYGLAEVATRTGFSSISALSRAYRRCFGRSPSADRAR